MWRVCDIVRSFMITVQGGSRGSNTIMMSNASSRHLCYSAHTAGVGLYVQSLYVPYVVCAIVYIRRRFVWLCVPVTRAANVTNPVREPRSLYTEATVANNRIDRSLYQVSCHIQSLFFYSDVTGRRTPYPARPSRSPARPPPGAPNLKFTGLIQNLGQL